MYTINLSYNVSSILKYKNICKNNLLKKNYKKYKKVENI